MKLDFSHWGFWLWPLVNQARCAPLPLAPPGYRCHDWWRREKGIWFRVVLVLLSVLRCFGIWPCYWTHPLLCLLRTDACILSLFKFLSFRSQLINPWLFCASQQSLFNPVTIPWVFSWVHVSVHRWAPLHQRQWNGDGQFDQLTQTWYSQCFMARKQNPWCESLLCWLNISI